MDGRRFSATEAEELECALKGTYLNLIGIDLVTSRSEAFSAETIRTLRDKLSRT